jgi:hypothetical protein
MPMLPRSKRAAARNAAALALQQRRIAGVDSGELPEGYAEEQRAARQQRQEQKQARSPLRGQTRPGSHRIVPSSSSELKQSQAEYAERAKAARAERVEQEKAAPKATEKATKKPVGRPKKTR